MKTQPIGCPYCGSLIDDRTGWRCPSCLNFPWAALLALALVCLLAVAALGGAA